MFIDMPMFEAGAPSAYVVAQAQTSQAASQNLPNQLGVCSEYRANASHSVRPIFGAEFYINEFKKGPNVLVTENGLIKIRMDATIRIVKQPSHGSLVLYKPDAKAYDISKYDYNYLPNKDYEGEDNFQFDISLDGKTLRVYYQVMVFPEDENPNYVGFCNWEKYYYKISSSTPALDNASLQALLGAANIDSSVNVTFSNTFSKNLGVRSTPINNLLNKDSAHAS